MITFFSGATMKWTGCTREVAVVGQLETDQEGNLLPEDFPPDEKNGKWSEAIDRRQDTIFPGKTVGS